MYISKQYFVISNYISFFTFQTKNTIFIETIIILKHIIPVGIQYSTPTYCMLTFILKSDAYLNAVQTKLNFEVIA